MPLVNIKIAGELSRDQKKQIVEEITGTMERLTHKPRQYVVVNFDETKEENWGWGGMMLDGKD